MHWSSDHGFSTRRFAAFSGAAGVLIVVGTATVVINGNARDTSNLSAPTAPSAAPSASVAAGSTGVATPSATPRNPVTASPAVATAAAVRIPSPVGPPSAAETATAASPKPAAPPTVADTPVKRSAPLATGQLELALSAWNLGLDTSGATSPGSPIEASAIPSTWPSITQQWEPELQADGYYVFYSWNLRDQSVGLEVGSGSGAGSKLGAYHGQSDMQWSAVRMSQTGFEFVNVDGGECLQAVDRGAPAVDEPCTGAADQVWALVRQYP